MNPSPFELVFERVCGEGLFHFISQEKEKQLI